MDRFTAWKDREGAPVNKSDRNTIDMLRWGWSSKATFPHWRIIDAALASLGGRGRALLLVTPAELKAAIEREMKRESLQVKDMGEYAPSKVAATLERWQEWKRITRAHPLTDGESREEPESSEEEADEDAAPPGQP